VGKAPGTVYADGWPMTDAMTEQRTATESDILSDLGQDSVLSARGSAGKAARKLELNTSTSAYVTRVGSFILAATVEILGALLQSIGNERASELWRMDDGFLSCVAKVCLIMQRGRSRLYSRQESDRHWYTHRTP
jgi:hypothetical protein